MFETMLAEHSRWFHVQYGIVRDMLDRHNAPPSWTRRTTTDHLDPPAPQAPAAPAISRQAWAQTRSRLPWPRSEKWLMGYVWDTTL